MSVTPELGRIFLTGDTHRCFGRIEELCRREHTTRKDVLVILGDAGINYYGPARDQALKWELDALPITLLCIHGNHEQRPSPELGYEQKLWRGGAVWVEEPFRNLLFAVDGAVYDLAGRSCLAVGGAYSVDKDYRLALGLGWWPDEQPDDTVKARVEGVLEDRDWQVDVVFSHTCPICYEPTEVFLPSIDQRSVDKSTEMWLGSLEYRLRYQSWYCGHYHTSKTVDRLHFLFEEVIPFP